MKKSTSKGGGKPLTAETRLTEKRYRAIFDNSPSTIMFLDMQGKILNVNTRAYDVIGYKPEEIIGKNIFSIRLLSGNNKVKVRENLLKLRQGRILPPYKIEFVTTRNEKRLGKIRSSATKEENGNIKEVLLFLSDITERKLSEEELRESEEMYRILVETSQDAVTVTDLKGTIIYVSDDTTKLHGYGSAEELLGTDGQKLVAPEDREIAKKNIKRTLGRGYQRDVVYRLLRKDGSRFVAEVNAALIKDAYGRPKAFIVTERDITRRREAEDALQRSERTFRTFFENEPEYCYMISPDGMILEANRAALKALGYKKSELVGKPLKAIYAPESLPKARKLFAKWKKTGKLRNEEITIIGKNGDRYTVLLSVGVVKDDRGKVLNSVSVQRDITERKGAEKALKESKARYSAVVENSRDAIIVIQDGILKFVNKASKRLVGYKPSELLGSKFIGFVAPEYRELVRKRYAARLKGKRVPHIYELALVKKDGRKVPVEINATVIDYEGKPADLVFIREIVGRKKS
jgi:PAS domain S-box-containing protein